MIILVGFTRPRNPQDPEAVWPAERILEFDSTNYLQSLNAEPEYVEQVYVDFGIGNVIYSALGRKFGYGKVAQVRDINTLERELESKFPDISSDVIGHLRPKKFEVKLSPKVDVMLKGGVIGAGSKGRKF